MLLKKAQLIPDQSITITGSKSETNRLFILNKIWGNILLENISNSEDSILLEKALEGNSEIVDVHHCGTAMRFLTAYFATQPDRNVILTGSERLQQRPIIALVEALQSLGAEIHYLNENHYPPLRIIGKKLTQNEVKIPADISSQFITALMLIGGSLENGLKIKLLGEVTSRPYIEMSLQIINKIGIKAEFLNNQIFIPPYTPHQTYHYKIESDWSSASYFYSMCAIGKEKISLKSFKKNSLQGDSILVDLFENYFGVRTLFNDENSEITLSPQKDFIYPKEIQLCLNNYPDIAQTICVTASALKIPFKLTGLKTLKIKETDRLIALQNELLKIGTKTQITDESIYSTDFIASEDFINIKTYNDHRIAMSFAPFSLIQEIKIQNPEVVEKSYPDFWRDFNFLTKTI